MEHRYLGDSGLKVSALAYGNWITHGGQIGEDAAVACVQRALDLGITTFDTADVYSETRAESVLADLRTGASRWVRWRSDADPRPLLARVERRDQQRQAWWRRWRVPGIRRRAAPATAAESL